MNQAVKVSRGNVVGIGEIKILKTRKLNKELPVFSFIMLQGKKEEKGLYISTCIDLRVDGYGKTELSAVMDMGEAIYNFLLENFTNPKCKDNALSNLIHLARYDEWSNELWNAYLAARYKFVEKNKPLDFISVLSQKEKLKRQLISNTNTKKKELEQVQAHRGTLTFNTNPHEYLHEYFCPIICNEPAHTNFKMQNRAVQANKIVLAALMADMVRMKVNPFSASLTR